MWMSLACECLTGCRTDQILEAASFDMACVDFEVQASVQGVLAVEW